MFNSNHYVPILKWKRAEQGALESLSLESKKYITPLIQFVMPKQKPEDTFGILVEKFKKQLNQIADDVVEIWGKEPIFLDFSLLFTTELKLEAIKDILSKREKTEAYFIPVIHLADEDEIKKIVCELAKEIKTGLCLRLVYPDLLDISKLNSDLGKFMPQYGLNESTIDLIVDIKELGKDASLYEKYFEESQKIRNLENWRTFIFAGGSFPEDLTLCKIDEENLLPRSDWNKWREKQTVKNLKRKATYSDYTIQYPIYKEMSQFFHPTSSIKYTLDGEWLVMKGQKQKFELYLASAAELVKDKRFYGENFCQGDKYIADKAKHYEKYIREKNEGRDIKGTGSTETWLKAGINHHLTLAANQVASLSLKK